MLQHASPTGCTGVGAVWIYTYTDCAGNTADWTYTYTVNLAPFTIAYANGASTVNCPADANVQPADPGVVNDACGNPITPTVTAPTAVACEGDMVWTFTYTDCAGNTADWLYTYTVDMPTFTIATPAGASTVNCPADANIQPADAGVVTDLCGNVLTPIVTAPTAVACEGDMVWTFTYTDCAGNSVDWTHTYTVDMPTFTIATPAGASTVNCPADANVQPADAGVVTDLCGNVITPTVTAPTAVACEGDMIWTFTYTDCAGNSVDWTHTYTVDMPTFTIATPAGASTVNCPADANVQPADAGVVTDLCGNVLTPTVTAPTAIACEGDMIWTFTYTDCAGNSVDWTHTYTIDIPTFTIPYANGASTVNCVADAQVDPGNPGVVTDQCGNTLTPVVTAPSPTGCTGVGAVWIYTYTDCAGNTADWTYTYTVNLAPFTIAYANGASTVNCPADANVQPADPGVVNDACGNPITPTVTAPTAVACEGDMVWTFTYTDCAGNTADWLYTYTVDMPTFTIATPAGASTVNCPADANVQPADAGVVTDLCGNVLTPVVTAPTAVACEGDMVWTFTYTDCAGNSVDWTHTYTVDMPTFTIATPAGASTVNCPADANVQPADAGVVTDLCGNVITPTVTAPTAVACEGDMVWTFTYTDCAGNSVDWTHTYTVDMPTFTIATPAGASTVNCPADANVQPADAGVVTDLCGNVLTPTVTAPTPIACEGDMIWTFTYTDCAGNSVDWTHTYTIDVPAFTIPYANGASTVNCVADAQVDPGAPGVVIDQCGNTLTPVVTAPSPTGCTGVGAVWIYTYTDCAGNTADWTYTYTINLAPFTIPYANGASTVNCPADANVQPADPGAVTDQCGNVLTPVVTAPTAVACEGDMVWTFTYTDCAGNTADWLYTYTVDMPTFTIATPAGASTVNCPADANVQPADAGVVTDLCGNVLTPTVTAPTAVACEGDMVWTFTYTDCAGNSVDWTHTYTVDMPTFTIATPAGASTVNCPADANVQPADAGVVTDLCGNVITPTVTAPTAVACEGDMVWTFTYTDCAGNSVDWTHTYTVDMPTFTIATPAGASTVNCPADANVQPADAGVVTDLCGNVLTPTVTAPTPIACEGDMIWTFTYTDCAGNSVDWTHTYTIDVPAFTIPYANGASTVNCSADAVQPADPGPVTDACGNVITPVVTAPSPAGCTGGMIWTFTYTDCAGNTADWTYTYTIDLSPFTIPYADGASTVDCVADANVQPADPGAVTDQCGNVLTPVVTAPTAVACEGDMVWTFTYTDCAGNTADWLYTYTVDMPTFTIATPAGASTVNCPADANVQPADAGVVTDICGNVLTPVVTAPTAVACEGDMVWTFTYTDCAGNSVDWTHTYTVDMPTFTIATPAGASTVNCPADANVQPADAGVVTDLCGNVITPTVTAPTAVACEGDMVWTFTYTDCAGNSVDWTHTYTVDMPTFTIATPAGASTVDCPADANVQPADAGVVTDLCGNVLTPTLTAPTPIACEGDMIWTFTYTDCAGNSVDWTHTYTIDVPAFTIPYANGASTVNCVADAQVDPGAPGVVTDQCGNTLTPVVTAPSPTGCTGVGAVWIYTYTDCAGNTADWTYTYTINLAPFTIPYANGTSTVNCAADAVQPASPGQVTDLCGNVLTPVITAPTAVACEGDMIWTFTYTDCAGNTADWTYTYTVDLPAFALPADGASTVECLAHVTVPVPPAITDLCGNAIVPVMTQNADPVCEGDKIFTFTYTDCAGNTADWIYTYTIDIITAPVVPANGTESVVCFDDVYIPTPPVVTDVCGNAIVPVMTEGADPVCVGDKVYTFTYTDCSGNATDWTYTFSINDDVAPTASNPVTISVPGSMNVPAPDVTVVTDEADNCDPNPQVTWVNDVSTGTPCVDEVIVRTYMITDACGNTTTVTQNIIIEAVYPPVNAGVDQIICAGESVTLTADNPMGVTPVVWTSPAFTPVTDGVPFSPMVTGVYTVTLDNLGCISTDDVTVVVEDLPQVSFIGDVLAGCEPLTVVFTNTSTATSGLDNCTWEFEGDPQTYTGCNDVTYTFQNGGTYDVTLTTQSVTGCTASVTYTDYVYVEDTPVAEFSASTTELLNINTEVDFNNTSTGATDYVWDFGYNTANSTEVNPTHVFPEENSGAYVVELFAYSPLGCVDSAQVTINVVEETIYYVPNSFTPDGDAFNQYFQAIFTSGYDPFDFELLIFNRWGEVIWESHDDSVGWDGTYNGEIVPDGVYTWKIEFKTSQNDERKIITGHVNVLR